MFNTISTANERFLADLSNLEGRLLTAQRQVSSGLRMQSVADDPDQVSALLAVKAQIAHNSQLKYNLGRVQTEVNAAENAINTAATLMDRARQIAAQGASSTTTVDTRTQLAGQVKDIITEMFGLTQTQVEGRYVFSGDSDQTPPYLNVDLTQPNGVGAYQGSSGTRQVEHPNGSIFSISYTADQVFDSGGVSSSVFQSLTALYNDLQSSNIANLSTDADNIGMAASFLDGQQARYGGNSESGLGCHLGAAEARHAIADAIGQYPGRRCRVSHCGTAERISRATGRAASPRGPAENLAVQLHRVSRSRADQSVFIVQSTL